MSDELKIFAIGALVVVVFIVSATSCTVHENGLRATLAKACIERIERAEQVTDCAWAQRSLAR
jgi:hypothetical protein